MLSFLFLEGNGPFLVALAIMLGIAVLEGVTTLLGGALSNLLDSLVPDGIGDVDVDLDADFDIDADVDVDIDINAEPGAPADHPGMGSVGSANALSKLLGWLFVGKVPLLVLIVTFLTLFGVSGLILQGIAFKVFGTTFSGYLMAIPAFLISFPGVRLIGRGLARMMPRDETSAISRNSFVGRVATIMLGTATQEMPAQAKLQDEHGLSHYVMVEPDRSEDSFTVGDKVLLIERRGASFRVIRATDEALLGK